MALLVGVVEQVDQVLRAPAGRAFAQVVKLGADLLDVPAGHGAAADLVIVAGPGPFSLVAGRAG